MTDLWAKGPMIFSLAIFVVSLLLAAETAAIYPAIARAMRTPGSVFLGIGFLG
jgi:hypothetical protein